MENEQQSSSGNNAKDVVSENIEEKGITMVDVLKDEDSLEQEANAVLGAGDDENCTYPSGCMTRQALYACETCSVPKSPDFVPAGVCLACSYHCHEGHTLVELYTKRQFQCDCGTSRITSSPCTLNKSKEKREPGVQNKYNQNFSGVYCTCSRPYPDPEDTEPDQMIQCMVCEDWYHGRHLGMKNGPPDDSDYGEMICVGCTEKYSFLAKYRHLSVISTVNKDDEKSEVDIEKTDVEAEAGEKEKESKCLVKSGPKEEPGTLFLPESWRSSLCQCVECMEMYEKENLKFLLDPSDTVHSYEAKARGNKGQFEQGMEALSQMDRVKQVEAIHSYNTMKGDLMEYLGKFAANGKVVREEDIKEFFEKMKANKKPRLGSTPPSTCK